MTEPHDCEPEPANPNRNQGKELVPDIPDFDGVELEAIEGIDGGLRCFLGSHQSGIPSMVETILANADKDQRLDELIRDMCDLLSQHIQLGHNNPHLPDAPLEDANRYYELQTAGWFLSPR